MSRLLHPDHEGGPVLAAKEQPVLAQRPPSIVPAAKGQPIVMPSSADCVSIGVAGCHPAGDGRPGWDPNGSTWRCSTAGAPLSPRARPHLHPSPSFASAGSCGSFRRRHSESELGLLETTGRTGTYRYMAPEVLFRVARRPPRMSARTSASPFTACTLPARMCAGCCFPRRTTVRDAAADPLGSSRLCGLLGTSKADVLQVCTQDSRERSILCLIINPPSSKPAQVYQARTPYTTAVDVYSAAMTTWCVCAGVWPRGCGYRELAAAASLPKHR